MLNSITFNKKNYILLLFISTIIFYGFSLPISIFSTPRFSPGNDFSNHAHYMHAFAESFKSGQIIPRTIAKSSGFSDATDKTDLIPTFQYYGFFEGLAALPFQLLHIPDALCAILSSILLRFIGLYFLFETGILLGASLFTSFIACIALLISPYTMTVYYGRGALAESFAQSLLLLIPYGFALAFRGKKYKSIIILSIAIAFLSLCHNIFFLYGVLLLGILALFSFQPSLIITMGIGSVIGVLISAWQWLPAQLTVKDTVIFGGLLSWKIGGAGLETRVASLNGMFGFPHPWTPYGMTKPLPLFHTIAWWTLPFMLFLIKGIYNHEKIRIAFPFFIASLIFMLLTFSPINETIYYFLLPQLLTIVQDTSRLIGFLSIFASVGLILAFPNLNKKIGLILLFIMLITQVPVFMCYLKLANEKTWSNDEVKGSPINYYYVAPTQLTTSSIYTDKIERHQIKRSDGSLSAENLFYVSPELNSYFLQLSGVLSVENDPQSLSILPVDRPKTDDEYKIIKTNHRPDMVIEKNFNNTLEIKNTSLSGWYQIVAQPINKKNTSMNQITLTNIMIGKSLKHFISADHLEPFSNPKGYSRAYLIKNNEHLLKNVKYTIELPAAYSKLFHVTQAGTELKTMPSFNHRILIETDDLIHPIQVGYHLDNNALWLTLLGMSGLFFVVKKQKKIKAEQT